MSPEDSPPGWRIWRQAPFAVADLHERLQHGIAGHALFPEGEPDRVSGVSIQAPLEVHPPPRNSGCSWRTKSASERAIEDRLHSVRNARGGILNSSGGFLILCKASLGIKWQMEMRKRFDLRFDIWRSGQLREFHRRYREDEDLGLRAMTRSLAESFRNTGVGAGLGSSCRPPLDVLIVGEGPPPQELGERSPQSLPSRRGGGRRQSSRLTATPIQIGSRDAFSTFCHCSTKRSLLLFSTSRRACCSTARLLLLNRKSVGWTLTDLKLRTRYCRILVRIRSKFSRKTLADLRTSELLTSADLAQGWASVSQALRQHPLYVILTSAVARIRSCRPPRDRGDTAQFIRTELSPVFLAARRRRGCSPGVRVARRVVEIHG